MYFVNEYNSIPLFASLVFQWWNKPKQQSNGKTCDYFLTAIQFIGDDKFNHATITLATTFLESVGGSNPDIFQSRPMKSISINEFLPS